MMSVIEMIIARLRQSTSRFEDRVAGLAELNWLRQEQNLRVPAAFVLPGGESVSNQTGQAGITNGFDITHSYQVAVWLDANADPRNQQTTHQLDDIRNELLLALVPWRPQESFHGFRYGGMQVGGQDQDRSIYLYTFTTVESLWLNCGRNVEVGGIDPAVQIAANWGAFHEAPELNRQTGRLEHRRGVGFAWNDPGCEPDDVCPNPAFATQLKEGDDNGSNDACPG